MKKFFAAACCTMLIASASFAQDATPVATPGPVVEAVAEAAADAAPVEAAPVEVAPVEAAPVVAAPITSDFVEGTVVSAPLAGEYPIASPIIQQGCGCSGSAPVVAAPVTSDCGCTAAAPAPASTCGCADAAPAAPACCPQTRQRRYVVRSAVSRLRSRRTSCCN